MTYTSSVTWVKVKPVEPVDNATWGGTNWVVMRITSRIRKEGRWGGTNWLMVRNSPTSQSRSQGGRELIRTYRTTRCTHTIKNSETRVKYSIRFNQLEKKTCGGGGCVSATRLCYWLSRPVWRGEWDVWELRRISPNLSLPNATTTAS